MPELSTLPAWLLIAGWLGAAVAVCSAIVVATLRGPRRHKEYGDGHDD